MRRTLATTVAAILLSLSYAGRSEAIPTGPWPLGIAVNAATNRIYIANSKADSVTVIDGATGARIARIPVGLTPNEVAVNPLTNRIYVTNGYGDSVSVIDGETQAVSATIPVQTTPTQIAVNTETNRIYVANWGADTVSVIDGSTDVVISTVPMGKPRREYHPSGVGVSIQTNRIYVGSSRGDPVSVIDGATGKVIREIPVGTSVADVAVNPVTNRIYVLRKGAISIIDGETDMIIRTIRVGDVGGTLAVNHVRNRLYRVGIVVDSLLVIDGADDTIVDRLPLNVDAYRAAVNPVTDRIYITNYVNGNVSVIYGNEMLLNPSFDIDRDNTSSPDRWHPWSLPAGDGLVEDAYDGQVSLRFGGAPSGKKHVMQRRAVAGLAGTGLNVEAVSKADGTSPTGGAYKVKVDIVFVDDTEGSFEIDFSKRTHGWQRRVGRFVVPKDYKEVIVHVIYENQTGQVWFDALHLWPD